MESLDSWQRRVLGWDKDLLWEDSRVKGYRALSRGHLALAFNGERNWLYLYVSPKFQKFMLSFQLHEPVSRSRVDHWLTWKIVSERHSFPIRYETDYLRRCRRILSKHPESVMSLLGTGGVGFDSKLWAYLARETLSAN